MAPSVHGCVVSSKHSPHGAERLQSLALPHQVSESALQLVAPLYSDPKKHFECINSILVDT
jgi:hypothetical protein